MRKLVFALAISTALLLAGCNRSAKKPSDPLEAQLQQLAGKNANNCGRVAQQEADVKKASDCALQANEAKRSFYVAYELPGMTVALAGNGNTQYSVEYNPQGWQGQPANGTLSDDKKTLTTTCPAPLRLAQSGRVTCNPPGVMGGGAMGANPHGGMMMPPGTANPHEGMPGMGSGGMTTKPGVENPHATQPGKTAKPQKRSSDI